MTWLNPTPEAQVQFLRNVQRLLAEGQFVASYKFALIHTLADLAVLKGDDTGAPLDLDTKDIAKKFVELYWRQCRPFQGSGDVAGLVLYQSTGKQAEIVSKIAAAHQTSSASLFRFKNSDQWPRLVAKVDRVVREMPLWKLQRVGEERLEFLYENQKGANRITLKTGVTYCLRAFYELVRDLIEGALRYVQKVNANRLGTVTDLGTFLFGEPRASLETYRPILMDVQNGTCLYCQKSLGKETQVDHFIPWSRYPTDLGHNFVLAHTRCNGAKSDHLAAERHLAAWAERNLSHQKKLEAQLRAAALPSEPAAALQIARWVYQQTEQANGQVWVESKVLQRLGPNWSRCLLA